MLTGLYTLQGRSASDGVLRCPNQPRRPRYLAHLTAYEREPVFADERPGDIQAIYLDTSRARERWGWEATTT